MKISARNAFKGKIDIIKPGAVNSEVDLTIGGSDKLVAIVTNESVKTLGLTAGKEVTALVKASSVLVLAEGSGVKLSARNCLPGIIKNITNGPVSAEVAITLTGGAVVHATITHDAVVELGLKEGASASAVFKASAVILGVNA
ncbi:MAG TPA: TOBE domain-containing protein [Rhodocyclaceae bacterium]|jgi:molybdate transport system regulatory protein